ncbi:MAG: HAMP domain-containing protein [Ignavibacteria bacterium]|nr:HAMP domain-containing protein [Ignavibacteria bacterium]
MNSHPLLQTRLKLGVAVLLLFVIVLGVVSYRQSTQIHAQTELIFNHPLPVRRALEGIRADVLQMHVHMLALTQVEGSADPEETAESCAILDENAARHLATLSDRYLGSRADVDSLAAALARLRTLRAEALRRIQGRQPAGIPMLLHPHSPIDRRIEQAMERIAIATSASATDTLYAASHAEKGALDLQLSLLVGAILLLSVFVGYTLLRAVRAPLNVLTGATERFRAGDFSARSAWGRHDEFGVLSDAFNELAASLQRAIAVRDGTAAIAGVLLRENETRAFFRAMLATLARHTGSQMAAVYLRSSSGRTFDHFESIGVDNKARESFNAEARGIGPARPLASCNMFGASRRIPFRVSFPRRPRAAGTITVPIRPREIVAIVPRQSRGVRRARAGAARKRRGHPMRASAGMPAHMSLEGLSRSHRAGTAARRADIPGRGAARAQRGTRAAEGAARRSRALEDQFPFDDEPRAADAAQFGHRPVVGAGRRLSGKIADEEYRFLEVIGRNGKHLLSLINDILDIARIEAGRDEIDIGEFSPAAVVGMRA